MAGGRRIRALTRLPVLIAAGALLAGVGLSHGVLAAPARQSPAVVGDIRRQVAEVRGLEVKTETPLETMGRPALVSRLSRDLNEPKTVREFLTSQMLLEVLGAMQRGFDLRQLQLNLLEEQIVALYDYQDRVIFLVADALEDDDLGADARLIVAHEFTHALQDQHFDLRRVLPATPQNSDADAAARALVEGDAMLTMRIWGRQHLRPSDKRSLGDATVQTDPVLDTAPPLVQGELLFPYDAGWVFAQLLYQDGGFVAIDQAFLNPPRSTEQILHPEKYHAGEAPIGVAIAPLEQTLGGTWKTLRTDVFGELVLRLLLEPQVGWPVAEAAAAGWGGDAYTILEDGDGRRIVGMVTVWDTEADAAEMYNAFVASLEEQYRATQRRTIRQPSLGRWTIPEYQVQALKTDNVVRIIYAPDAAILDQVEAQLATAAIGVAAPPPAPPAAAPSPSVPGPPAVPSPTVPDPAAAPAEPPASEQAEPPAPPAAPSPVASPMVVPPAPEETDGPAPGESGEPAPEEEEDEEE